MGWSGSFYVCYEDVQLKRINNDLSIQQHCSFIVSLILLLMKAFIPSIECALWIRLSERSAILPHTATFVGLICSVDKPSLGWRSFVDSDTNV